MSLTSSLNPQAIFTTLADLISINSVNPHYRGGPGEGAIAEYVAQFFKKYSIPFEVKEVLDGRPNVIGKLEGRPGGRTLILEAHTDTASEQGMSVNPFKPTRIGNLMYGRGSCDTKGGLAAMMHSLKLLRDCHARPAASVLLLAAADEEYSYRGVAKFIEDGVQADGAIVAEPTDLETAVASKGALRWWVQTRGRAAHSSKPYLGINAITKMAKLIVAMEERLPAVLRKHHPLLGSPALNVGVISGGIQVNQVPACCRIEVDYRMLPGDTRDQVWKEFESLVSEMRARDPEFEAEMEPAIIEDFPFETSPEERIVQVTTKVSQDVRGRHSRLLGVPYGSDASKLSRAGIPSLILGPGNIDQAHAQEEYVELDQVALASEIYARTILEF